MNYSQVNHNPENHTYWLECQELKGITGVIERRLFPKKYDGIPKYILDRAAERGSEIHDACRRYDMFGSKDLQETENYAALCSENGIEMIENEYLVSDNETYASMIDCVDKDYNLYDIKTTAVLDEEYLSWQLSIYAYLFELQNTELKAGKLYGIWLRGDIAKLVEVNKIDERIIKELLECDKNDCEFINPFKKELELSNTEKVIMLENAIIQLKEEIKAYEQKKEEFLSAIEQQMVNANFKKWESDRIMITRVLPTTSTTFDSKLFQSENPEVYKNYLKETTKKGYIKITLK